ncbi:divergent PAP2 family protein [Candidatus Saccharibacteria bacterium]|nr:divergent PAP2 family protein [Candidatus Saccharibacteria bacterium]
MIYTDIWNVFSPYLVSFLLTCFIAESVKIILKTIKHRQLRLREFSQSGGMPSLHSAAMTALAVTTGLLNGFGSVAFAIVVSFACIVIYDAVHVRRAVGEQGEVIQKIIERDAKLEREISSILGEKTSRKLRKPYLARGHKPLEALVGSLIGVVVGVVVAYLSVG